VTSVVLPVVVDGVQQGVAGDLRGATGSTIDVVAFERDLILCAAIELVHDLMCPIPTIVPKVCHLRTSKSHHTLKF
jgi:hypothetical protein